LTILGAVLGGEAATRFGVFHALWALGLLQALSNLVYSWAALHPWRPWIYGASVIESLSSGLGTAAFLACLMRLCEGRQAATRFALLTALAGLTRTLAGAVSGYGAAGMGYPTYFALTFAMALPAFALLPLLRSRIDGIDGRAARRIG
jgi:PAT family beta-lactamase induction signal transducer AmpG